MAEFVQRRLEESVPQLLLLKDLDLTDDSELQSIIKRRRRLEYRVERQVKTKQVYLDYIKYELNFLMLIQTRIKRKGMTIEARKIERPMVQRIKNLFEDVIHRYPSDMNLWRSYIDFCVQRRHFKKVGRIYSSMMHFRSDKPIVWVEASRWEVEHNDSLDSARLLLMRGLRFIPKCKEIYIEMLRLELATAESQLYSSGMVSEFEINESDLIEACKVAFVIYRNAIKEIEDDGFLKDLLDLCRKFKCSKPIQDAIYSEFEKSDNEDLLALVASRPFHDAMNAAPSGSSCLGNPEKACIANFEAAILSKPTRKMWNAYFEFCFDCLGRLVNEESEMNMQEHLLKLFERGHEASMLKSKLYLRWANLMADSDSSRCLEIYDEALRLYPKKADIWENKILFLLGNCQSLETVKNVFKEVTSKSCFKTCLPLWKLAFRWSLVIGSHRVKRLAQCVTSDSILIGRWCPEDEGEILRAPLVVETCRRSTFKRCRHCILPLALSAMAHPVPVGSYIKVHYLEWIAVNYGIKEARQLYRDHWNVSPVCEDFFFKMCELEEASLKPKRKMLREVMENACALFGKESVDVWLRYIALERTYNVSEVDKAALVYSRALQTLRPMSVNKFLTHYNLLSTKILDSRSKV